MKSILRKAIYIYSILFLLLPISCFWDCGPFADRVRVSNLNWKTGVTQNIDTVGYSFETGEFESNSVKFDKFSIILTPELDYYISNHLPIHSFSLIPSAMACSEPKPPTLNVHVEKLNITTNKAYDLIHPKNSNVNDLFDVYVVTENHQIIKEDLVNYLLQWPLVPRYLILKLKTPPSQAEDFSFTVNYEQDGNGIKQMEYKSDLIRIEP